MNKKERHIPTTDYEIEDILKRSFKNVPNKAVQATPQKQEKLDTDFMTASRNFWLQTEGGKYYQKYGEGVLNGTYNTRQATFRSITETLMEAFKNILRAKCEEEDRTLEDLNLYLEMLEKTFELLCNKIDSTLDDKVDGEMMIAYLHAVFNSFIMTNIKEKE